MGPGAALSTNNSTQNAIFVTPQPGDFYAGWIASRVKGPFKGSPGTLGW